MVGSVQNSRKYRAIVHDYRKASSVVGGIFLGFRTLLRSEQAGQEQQRRQLNARMANYMLLHRRFEQLVAKLNVSYLNLTGYHDTGYSICGSN